MQTYLVPFWTKIAGIFSPYPDQDCRHIWSPTKWLLQAYSVPIINYEFSVLNLNLNNSDWRASKIISNDNKHESISLEPKKEHSLSHFCFGIWIRGHPPKNRLQENFMPIPESGVMIPDFNLIMKGIIWITSMLVTDVGDHMCWWQVWDVSARLRMLMTDLIN